MQSLEEYLGFTFSQNMVSARQKDRLAWVRTTKGIRNLFIASAPGYDPVQVTAWREDDGQMISGLQISDNGRYLLFIRGEGKNELDEYPNPLSLNQPPKQMLWFIDLENRGSQPVELAETSLACFRPDFTEIYFSRKGQLFRVDTADSTLEPEEVLSTRGKITELSWSDQGDRLAMTVTRYRHSFIGIHSPGQDRIQWLNPSFDRDIQPTWSADGQHIAYLKCHGVKPDITDFWFNSFSDRFELWVINTNSMKARRYWQCPEEHGLSLQEGDRPITWVNESQLLFSHEASGWDHVYRLDIDRRQVEALTEGEYLLHSYAVDRHGGWLYFTHNEGKHHGYHLSRLNLNNGSEEDLQSLLPEGSIAFQPVTVASGNAVGLIMGGDQQPLIPVLIKPDEQQVLCFGQPAYETGCRGFHKVEGISFQSKDGLEVHGQLMKPEGKGPFPALLTLHGGPWCQTVAGFSNWHGLSYVYAFCQYLVSQGFLVLSLNYRGSSGYGKAFRQPDPYCWNGATEYQDVQAAGEWLANRLDVDAQRIGIWGKSYGGYLTAMALARNSDMFKAGVDIEGCHHFPREFRQGHWNSEKFFCIAAEEIDEARERAQKALESSPWHYLDTWQSPVLLIHPDDDRNVHFEESQRLYDELRKRNVTVEGMAIPDEVHSFLRHSPWVEGYRRAEQFLKKYLKK
ncbi:prolyl oligopeptidase family serine peptidase [Endozoicomonas arenosclerae]|uniref:S9 family peptidase n=1 Tax=Endozoicomonas arenosclerae TaxID=1633495 RepID=UPI0007849EED|nr:prolyl oligopeptidase family serine peptidase [Endozoicomonas arenosclerae]